MSDALQAVRIAVRALLRQRAFMIVTVLTLGLGIGATTAMFSVVHGVLLRPLPYPEPERLVFLGQTARSNPAVPVSGSVSHLNFLDWQRESKALESLALYSSATMVVTNLGEADVVQGAIVTPRFFDVFVSPPAIGRTFSEEENRFNGPDTIILSYAFWQQRLGGRQDVLSQAVEVSGRPRPVIGVAPRGFEFPPGAQLYMPVRNNDEQCGRGCVYLNGLGRLAANVTAHAAQEEMSVIASSLEREFPDANSDTTVMVQTLQDRTVGSVRFALVVLLGTVIMVLCIACANVANLVLVRGTARQHEIAVRAALGASRSRIVLYLLTENLVLGVLGGLFGVLLAVWGLEGLLAVAPVDLPRMEEIRLDTPTLLFATTLVLVTTLVFGLGPASRLSGAPLPAVLGQRRSIGSPRHQWTRSALLAAEVGLSLVLLLTAGLFFRSLSALQHTDPGFHTAGLTEFVVSLPAARYAPADASQGHERIDDALAAMPGVTRVARSSDVPLGPSENVQSFTRPDRAPPAAGQDSVARIAVIDPEYFETLRIPLLAGRHFTAADRSGAPFAVVINRRMADVFWPGEDPLGRPIAISGREPGTIVGVVGNVRSSELGVPPQPEMFVPHAQSTNRTIHYILESPRHSADIVEAARQVVQRLDERLPLISPGSMESLVERQLGRSQFYVVLLALFAGLALLLAAVGIYGVVAYTVTQRTREIGVQMALGARRSEVVVLMLWHGLRPAVIGMSVGLALAVAGARAISALLYEVSPYDPLTFAAVTLTLLAIVVSASMIPARRASAVPPAEALMSD